MDRKPSQKTREVVRLTADVYKSLERELPAPGVGATTTDIQAGEQIGIQRVLRLLREGFVHETG